jgi:hypothetical protein
VTGRRHRQPDNGIGVWKFDGGEPGKQTPPYSKDAERYRIHETIRRWGEQRPDQYMYDGAEPAEFERDRKRRHLSYQND